MADILIATIPPSSATSDEIEDARRIIDDAFFKRLEKHLKPVGVKSPDTRFRRDILEAVARYLGCPKPEKLNRTNLRELIEYVCEVHQHLSALQKMLASAGKHDQLQSNFLLAVLGVTFARERRIKGPDYLAFRNLLDSFAEAVASLALAMGKERVPSAQKRTA